MRLEIRKAKREEYFIVQAFYDELIDRLQEFEYGPMWQKNIYPSYAYLKESIEKEELYIGMHENKVISAMIVNTHGNESYQQAKWNASLKQGEYVVIHALGVMPGNIKQGAGRQMVEYVKKENKQNYKAIRLDVLKGNLAASKLYESASFVKVDTIQMYYEDTGWTDFEMYEYVL